MYMYVPVHTGSRPLHTPAGSQVLVARPVRENPGSHSYSATEPTLNPLIVTLPLEIARREEHSKPPSAVANKHSDHSFNNACT